MGTRLVRASGGLALSLCLLLAPSTALAGAGIEMVFDPGVSEATRGHFQKAADAVNLLFDRYGIVLAKPVTVAVTDNDTESYVRAIMTWGEAPRAEAERLAKTGVIWGLSSGRRSAVILRNVPTRQMTGPGQSVVVVSPEEGFRTLPHEVFHQVAKQDRLPQLVNWLAEGPPELFKELAYEEGGFHTLAQGLRASEERVRKAGPLPRARELSTTDYKGWEAMGLRRVPTYDMAKLMTARLVGEGGFGKIVRFYQLLREGKSQDEAFMAAFGVGMEDFLTQMDATFDGLSR